MLGNPHVCGGIILSLDPAIILTAAHCVVDAPHPSTLSKNPYFVGYGHIERSYQYTAAVKDWMIHPKYRQQNNDTDMHYDVAILRLATPLTESANVQRVAIWPSDRVLPSHTIGTLMGFGYTTVGGSEAVVMQRITLNVTRFIANSPDMVEAISYPRQAMACHGDSGSPVVVYVPASLSPGERTARFAPYALGPLARIFGVRDLESERQTCPVPHPANNSSDMVINSFCNYSYMLGWIAEETGISIDDLTDPFTMAPEKLPKPLVIQKQRPMRWRIGVAEPGLSIGAIGRSIRPAPPSSPAASLSLTNPMYSHQLSFSFILLKLCYVLLVSHFLCNFMFF
ncbi:trypsin-like cysteine/serine peptidase domain-containing protein [Radiomyces spectabilis]|uniref:trypsin-like cysteine/serine peptidase domain-containing protein n=1 Tax=Radiomyces spectabilis TaxID=64574 RepID=UPI00221E875D|nr:trypsin-like cysteine/serine peptidase domain-containing protein [Radiomyces spectabilis]KAI8393996.1 trypsin-like cysteine/serine peptidase domain-containing protein [Radiomyces spectabilis]